MKEEKRKRVELFIDGEDLGEFACLALQRGEYDRDTVSLVATNGAGEVCVGGYLLSFCVNDKNEIVCRRYPYADPGLGFKLDASDEDKLTVIDMPKTVTQFYNELWQLVNQKRKLEANRLFRQYMGGTIQGAKHYLDSLQDTIDGDDDDDADI